MHITISSRAQLSIQALLYPSIRTPRCHVQAAEDRYGPRHTLVQKNEPVDTVEHCFVLQQLLFSTTVCHGYNYCSPSATR
jgi:hypothetical protein